MSTSGPRGGQDAAGGGPLAGVRVLELAGIAPAPFGCMVLADLGADVVAVDPPQRPGLPGVGALPPLGRSRRRVVLDLRRAEEVETLLALVELADVLVDPYRPGVAERLGVGPEVCGARNPRLVFARLTGWGQTGPRAADVGHDIDYVALSGALYPLGPPGSPPVPPLNLVGDFGGGGMLLAVGVLAALLERERSGRGQVVDVAMLDGAALLTAFVHATPQLWERPRGQNLLDGGAPFYATYACADGAFLAVGALEDRFYEEFVDGLGLHRDVLPDRADPAAWPALREVFARVIATGTQQEWVAAFALRPDACVAPVLRPLEAAAEEHNRARGVFVEVDGRVQPAPAPRFARTPALAPRPAAMADPAQVLAGWRGG